MFLSAFALNSRDWIPGLWTVFLSPDCNGGEAVQNGTEL